MSRDHEDGDRVYLQRKMSSLSENVYVFDWAHRFGSDDVYLDGPNNFSSHTHLGPITKSLSLSHKV